MAQITNIPRRADWVLVSTSAANTANTLVQPAWPQGSFGAGLACQIAGLQVSWTGAPPDPGVNVQVWDGPASTGTLLFDAYIADGGETQGVQQFTFPAPLATTPGNALTIVMAAGGSGVVTKVCAQGVALSTTSL